MAERQGSGLAEAYRRHSPIAPQSMASAEPGSLTGDRMRMGAVSNKAESAGVAGAGTHQTTVLHHGVGGWAGSQVGSEAWRCQVTTHGNVEWMCTHCGKREIKAQVFGRPLPGKCPRKPGDKPHTWAKNRTL
jgi:hypothetical protein